MPNACESLGTGWLYDSRIGVSLNGGEGAGGGAGDGRL